MLHDGRYKLIYYAYGNRLQLFDLQNDPHEHKDLGDSPEHAHIRDNLVQRMVGELYGNDHEWLAGDTLIGIPADSADATQPDRTLSLQRGSHWPVPPQSSS